MSDHTVLIARLRELAGEARERAFWESSRNRSKSPDPKQLNDERLLREAADALATGATERARLRDELIELRAAMFEIEAIYNRDGVAHQNARRLEKLFDRYLHGDTDSSGPAECYRKTALAAANQKDARCEPSAMRATVRLKSDTR